MNFVSYNCSKSWLKSKTTPLWGRHFWGRSGDFSVRTRNHDLNLNRLPSWVFPVKNVSSFSVLFDKRHLDITSFFSVIESKMSAPPFIFSISPFRNKHEPIMFSYWPETGSIHTRNSYLAFTFKNMAIYLHYWVWGVDTNNFHFRDQIKN